MSKQFNLRSVIVTAVCLVGLMVFSSCEKEEFCESEFCRFANVEDFYKTTPHINNYLNSLPKELSNEQKLQALTEWLHSMPCIEEADLVWMVTIGPHDSDRIIIGPIMPPGTHGRISIKLKNGGLTLDIVSMKPVGYQYYDNEIIVYIGNNFTTSKLFDFINSFDHDVTSFFAGQFLSSLPTSNLNQVLNGLRSRSYISDVGHYLWPGLSVYPTFSSAIKNRNNQTDWFNAMNEFRLVDGNIYSKNITFRVPQGTEKKWIEKFKEYEFVIQADIAYRYREMPKP